MNIHSSPAQAAAVDIPPQEWDARVDLAAVYGWSRIMAGTTSSIIIVRCASPAKTASS